LMSHPLRFDDPVQGNDDVTAVICKMKKELQDYWEL